MHQTTEDTRVDAALAAIAPAFEDAGIVIGLVCREADRVDLHLEWTPGTCPERIHRALETARFALKRHLAAQDCRLVAPDGRRVRVR